MQILDSTDPDTSTLGSRSLMTQCYVERYQGGGSSSDQVRWKMKSVGSFVPQFHGRSSPAKHARFDTTVYSIIYDPTPPSSIVQRDHRSAPANGVSNVQFVCRLASTYLVARHCPATLGNELRDTLVNVWASSDDFVLLSFASAPCLT